MVAGWPAARQHPRGRNGTVFVTIEDETGYVQVIHLVAGSVAPMRRQGAGQPDRSRSPGSVSRWEGTTNVDRRPIMRDRPVPGVTHAGRPTTGTEPVAGNPRTLRNALMKMRSVGNLLHMRMDPEACVVDTAL